MRPRVIPAEDRRRSLPRQWTPLPLSFNEAAGYPRGRLGVPADEDCTLIRIASMRPRVIPAEDHRRHAGLVQAPLASMRPRVIPAEDGALDVERERVRLLQ